VTSVTFDVAGRPAPKGSRVYGTRKDGSSFSRPASRHEKSWTDAVALEATMIPVWRRPKPPYAVALYFRVARPARSTHGYPTRADLDKLVRGAMDGLVLGRLLLDDRHVTELHAAVDYGSPTGATITVGSAAAATERTAA